MIPAHNEAAGIGECLRRVSQQGPDVEEILVVDNGSTDDTAEIVRAARAEDSRIRLVTEPTPGVAHARYRGFSESRGDVIASIDSDTHVKPGWSLALAKTFADHPDVVAGTTPMIMWDLPCQHWYRRRNRRIEAAARRGLARGHPLHSHGLSGANSAIRRSAWESISRDVSVRSDVFEDLDRWLLLRRHGHRAVIVPGMAAVVSGRRLLSGPRAFLRYAACAPRTYALHGRWGMAVVASAGSAVTFLVTMIKLPVNRAWDPATQRFSLARLLGHGVEQRASPIG